MARIKFLLKPNGEVIAEGEDFTGPACLDAMRSLLENLGVVTSAEAKPEYYVQEDTHTLEGNA